MDQKERDDLLARMADQLDAFHERLGRVESMLIYMMDSEKFDIEVTPDAEQAKRLHTMGMAPWTTIKVPTSMFRQWHIAYQEKFGQGKVNPSPAPVPAAPAAAAEAAKKEKADGSEEAGN